MSDAPQKLTPDWERIELYYRAGILSLREIAAADGRVTEGAIRKRAKRYSWARDLAAKIKARSEELVRKDEVRKAVRSERLVSTNEAIEIGAQVITEVKLLHRSGIRRMREQTLRLLDEIEEVTTSRELFGQLGEMLRTENEAGNDKRNDIYKAVISLSGRIDGGKKLAETLKVLVGLEREAFGLGAASEGGGYAPDAAAPPIGDPQAYYAWFAKQGAT